MRNFQEFFRSNKNSWEIYGWWDCSGNDRSLKHYEKECKQRGTDPNKNEKYRNIRESTEKMKENGFGRRY